MVLLSCKSIAGKARSFLLLRYFFFLIKESSKNPSASLRIKDKRMAPPFCPAIATGPVCFFQSQPYSPNRFSRSFIIVVSLIIMSVAVQLYVNIKIEKYRGRSYIS